MDLDFIISAQPDLDLIILFWTFSQLLVQFWDGRLLYWKFGSVEFLKSAAIVQYIAFVQILSYVYGQGYKSALLCIMLSKLQKWVWLSLNQFPFLTLYVILLYITQYIHPGP